MTWIKICGITRKTDAAAIAGMGADCIGFIFSTDSPRRIGPDEAAGIMDGLEDISGAGVFVDEDPEMVTEYIGQSRLEYVQLSGSESQDYIKKLKQLAGPVKIIKVLRLKKTGQKDISVIAGKYLEHADYILLDSYDGRQYGGTGMTIDWEKAKGVAGPEKLMVSGGLYHGNAAEAIRILGPYGVDASSRLESSPGVKDLEKVKRFIKAVRDLKRQGRGNI